MSFIQEIACIPWSVVVDLYDIPDTDTQGVYDAHLSLQKLIVNANNNIPKLIQKDSFLRAKLNCAYLEDVLGSFSRACLDANNEEMISQRLIETCQELKLNKGELL